MNSCELYHGYTVNELKTKFDYDSVSGKFVNKMTGNTVYDFKVSVRSNDGDKRSTTLSLARVAIAFVEGEFPPDDFVVKSKDENRYNLAYDNLVVVHRNELNVPVASKIVVETATEGVFYNPITSIYIVRRGPTQAVYRTPSYTVAVAVRKEWEDDPSVHRWDATVPDWIKESL